MKKIICLLIIVFCIFALCACANTTNDRVITDTDTNTETTTNSGGNNTNTVSYKRIDIDLTKMNANMVYSQVYDMVSNPNKYIDKVVKMRGPFSAFYSSETNLYYPAVLIKDATACCSQGMEFVLNGNPSYPSGYPKKDSEITVVGKFDVYYEGSDRYCHLVKAIIV